MDIKVRELTGENLTDFNTCESEFRVEEQVILHLWEGRLIWATEPMTPFLKRYDPGDLNPQEYLDDPERTGFLAYADGTIAGQLLLRHNWNRFALIDDLRVDTGFRRLGVGRVLLDNGIAWARQQGLMGLMLDTQDTNVPACRFYEACGFTLAGFDRFLYRASMRYGKEMALFWYLVFDDVSGAP